MGDIKAIEQAIVALPAEELAKFRQWFAEFDGAAWDRQIEQDAASGRLDSLAAEALADYRSGSRSRNTESTLLTLRGSLKG
jgi:hypothetical protein